MEDDIVILTDDDDATVMSDLRIQAIVKLLTDNPNTNTPETEAEEL